WTIILRSFLRGLLVLDRFALVDCLEQSKMVFWIVPIPSSRCQTNDHGRMDFHAMGPESKEFQGDIVRTSQNTTLASTFQFQDRLTHTFLQTKPSSREIRCRK